MIIPKYLYKYPDMNLAFENAKSVNEVCENYINILTTTQNLCCIEYANKLREFISITEKIPMFEDEFHNFKKFLRDWSKSHNIHLNVTTRKKDFIGFNEKIRLLYPRLDKIHDLCGFRIVLLTPKHDSADSIELCYALLNDVITFFLKNRKCTILEAEELLDIGECSIPGIVVPQKNDLILDCFESKVKDYIRNPKAESGYQSLHCCVQTGSGLVFETQIRTFAMDLRSNHQSYKQKRYFNTHIDLDCSKITLPGIAFDENGELISDKSGLLRSTDLFDAI